MELFHPFIRGLLLSFGLIVALGPQNLFVIRMGGSRDHRLLAVTLCALCDALLIAMGLFGLGSLVTRSPWTTRLLAIVGGGFLFRTGVGLLVAPPVVETGGLEHESLDGATVCRTALGYSLLNPHAVLDTVIIIGGVGSVYAAEQRFMFGLGACLASSCWYWLLGHLGRSIFRTARGQEIARGVDRIGGLLLIGFAAKMLWGLSGI